MAYAREVVTAMAGWGGRSGRIARLVPILGWLPGYDRSWLAVDAMAGLTLWGLLVPEAMAYAGIAGLPPEAGLYTLTVSLLVYALLGTARHVSVGPTSATAALLASSVAVSLVAVPVASASDPQTYQAYAIGVRARHRRRLPGGRRGPSRVRHPVPVQAGHGRLRGGSRLLRGRRAAQQAARGGQAGWQHRREARRDRRAAAPGELGDGRRSGRAPSPPSSCCPG